MVQTRYDVTTNCIKKVTKSLLVRAKTIAFNHNFLFKGHSDEKYPCYWQKITINREDVSSQDNQNSNEVTLDENNM